jgi:hypothetical protein
LKRSAVELQGGPIECALSELQPVEIHLVEQEAKNVLWERVVGRHHYLGYRSYRRGRNLRYLVYGGGWLIGEIGWKSGSLKHRFLILDGVRVKNLASHLLGRNVRMVKERWRSRYGVRPYVLETFIDPLYSGACYRAAGWKRVGRTKGYAKLHCGYRYRGRQKEVYVVEAEFRKIIGCKERSCPQRRSRTEAREGKLRMMVQEVGYDPDLIDWAEIEEGMVGRLAEELREFHGLFADCFSRSEQRQLGESYLRGRW